MFRSAKAKKLVASSPASLKQAASFWLARPLHVYHARSSAATPNIDLNSEIKRSKKHNSKKKGRSSPYKRVQLVQNEALHETSKALNDIKQALLNFRYAAQAGDTAKVISLYPHLMQYEVLTSNDTMDIIRSLHHAQRSGSSMIPADELHRQAALFVGYYKQGQLSPHPRACLHTIGFFRDAHEYAAGIDFWNWVIKDATASQFLNMQTYGAAIELMALGGQPLEKCEDLYSMGLKNFQRGFNDYLLSEGSILTQPHLATTVPGTSTLLLQGIILARLIHNDWQGAYLGLDTALKLHPTQVPTYIMALFLDHRPLEEALKVFRLFCRSGSQVRPSEITRLLVQIAALQPPARYTEVGARAIQALWNTITYIFASGQKLDHPHLSLVLRVVINALPRPEAFRQEYDDALTNDDMETSDRVQALNQNIVQKIIEIFASQGIPSDGAILSTIALEAAKQHNALLSTWAINKYFQNNHEIKLRDAGRLLEASSLHWNATDFASLWELVSQKHGSLVRHAWAWKHLAIAAISSNHLPLFHETLENEHRLDAETRIEYGIILDNAQQTYKNPKLKLMSSPYEEIQSTQQFMFANAFVKSLEDTQDFLNGPRPRDIKDDTKWNLSIGAPDNQYPEKWYQDLYHDLNLKPIPEASQSDSASRSATNKASVGSEEDQQGHEVKVELSQTPDLTPTGLSISEVRYNNWKGITDLLLRAMAFEEKNYYHLTQSKGYTTSRRSLSSMGNNKAKREVMTKQLHISEKGLEHHKSWLADESQWRRQVMTLRRVNPAFVRKDREKVNDELDVPAT